MAKKIADAIVSQFADAYGELYEEKREIQEELDALKGKIALLGGDVIGDHWKISIAMSRTVRYPGLTEWMERNNPEWLRYFAAYSIGQRTTVRDLTKAKK